MHVLERTIVLHPGEIIESHMLPAEIMRPEASRNLSNRRADWTNGLGELNPENRKERLGDAAAAEEGVCAGEDSTEAVALAELPDPKSAAGRPTLAGSTLGELEKQAILDTLEATAGNKAEAARRLGISEKAIYNKLKRFGISR